MKVLAIILALFLTGCATTSKPVQITIKECPKATLPATPSYSSSLVSAKDTNDIKAKAMVKDFKACTGYAEELRTILQGYERLQ